MVNHLPMETETFLECFIFNTIAVTQLLLYTEYNVRSRTLSLEIVTLVAVVIHAVLVSTRQYIWRIFLSCLFTKWVIYILVRIMLKTVYSNQLCFKFPDCDRLGLLWEVCLLRKWQIIFNERTGPVNKYHPPPGADAMGHVILVNIHKQFLQ